MKQAVVSNNTLSYLYILISYALFHFPRAISIEQQFFSHSFLNGQLTRAILLGVKWDGCITVTSLLVNGDNQKARSRNTTTCLFLFTCNSNSFLVSAIITAAKNKFNYSKSHF